MTFGRDETGLAGSRYVPLTEVWPTHGLASVVIASLSDAGFHPMSECDSRGWLYVRGWPMGTHRPTTIWIPEDERAQAIAFLNAPFDLAEPEPDVSAGLWTWVSTHRPAIFAVWLVMVVVAGI